MSALTPGGMSASATQRARDSCRRLARAEIDAGSHDSEAQPVMSRSCRFVNAQME